MMITRVKKRQIEQLAFYLKLMLNLALFIIFISILIFYAAKFKTYFPIKSVKVYGVYHMDQQALQKVLGPLVKKGFFGIDVESIKDQLVHSPWVSTAVVRRVWPDQVLITVFEKTPVARWNYKTLLSNRGELFIPEKSHFLNSLPHFVGPEGQHIQIMEFYNKLSVLLKSLNFKVTRLELTNDLAWNLTFNNGMKINVGYNDGLTRLNHFVKVYPKVIGNRATDVEYIDLRYSNGLAVKWKTVI